jgi:hypothetical protein
MAALDVTFTIEQKCKTKVWSFVDTTPDDTGSNNGYGADVTGKASVALESARANIALAKLVIKDLKTSTTYDFSTGFLPTALNKVDEISSTEMLSTLTRIEDGAYEITYEVYSGVRPSSAGDLLVGHVTNGNKYAAHNSDAIGTTTPSNYVNVARTIDGVTTQIKVLNTETFTYNSSTDAVSLIGAGKIAARLSSSTVNKIYYCNAKECIRDEMLKFRAKCPKDHEMLKNINILDTELLGSIISFEKNDLTTVNASLRDIELICKIFKNKCNC